MIRIQKQEPLGKLSVQQRTRFNELKHSIQEAWTQAVVEVGKALWEIRDHKLYREEFDTFEAFCRATFDLSRSHAYQLIDNAKVNRNLSTIADKTVNVEVSRQLAKVPAHEQVNVYSQAVKERQRPTGKTVRAVIDEIQKPELKPSSSFEQGFKFLMLQGIQKLELDFERYTVIIIPK